MKNIPALRAKGLHRGKLNTRARSALVIKAEAQEQTDQSFFSWCTRSPHAGGATSQRRAGKEWISHAKLISIVSSHDFPLRLIISHHHHHHPSFQAHASSPDHVCEAWAHRWRADRSSLREDSTCRPKKSARPTASRLVLAFLSCCDSCSVALVPVTKDPARSSHIII